MLVVLAIISVLTTVTILGQSTFNKTLLLTETAYTMAFSARQAQSYGLSSRKFGASTNNPGYGLHFSRATLGQYSMFADTANTLAIPATCSTGTAGTPSAKPGNCRYDATDGTVNTYTFSRGFTIQKFCGKVTGQTENCSTDSSSPLTDLDMVFARPNTSTFISGNLNGTSLTQFGCAVITLTDQSGQGTRTIRISSLGEISVGQSLSCP